MYTQYNQTHSVQTNVPLQNPTVMQTHISSANQPIVTAQVTPISSTRQINVSPNVHMGIQENFNDPFTQMTNPMAMPNMGMGMDMGMGMGMMNPGQMVQNMILTMNRMRENMQSMAGGPNIQSMVNMQQGLGNGTMISKQYVSKIDYSNGTPKQESYQSQSIKQFGQDGHNISERQEAYKNTETGVQQAALQRLLDDKGTKTIRQRNINTGTQEQHDLYQGITENDLNSFNKQYSDYREKVHFQDNYKYLNSFGKGGGKYLLGKEGVQTTTPITGYLPSGSTTIPTTNIPTTTIPNVNIHNTNIPTTSIPQNYTQQLSGLNTLNTVNTVNATQPLAQQSYQFGVNSSVQNPFGSQVTVNTTVNPSITQSNYNNIHHV